MPRQQIRSLMSVLLVVFAGCASAPPERPPGAARDTRWYEFDWLSTSPHAPTFAVLDTESALGPYAEHAKTITLGDLVRMHGHACDGLVVAAAAMSVGLAELYPNGVIDRTDTGCISNNSPCFGDVAAYLTGGRIRFGTQRIDPDLGMSFVVYCFTTGEAVQVDLRDRVFPPDLRRLESKLRSGTFTESEMRTCQQHQWDFARGILQHPLADSFRTTRLTQFSWVPDPYPRTAPRGDIINRGWTLPNQVHNHTPGREDAGERRAVRPGVWL